jgi:hypothetical protein
MTAWRAQLPEKLGWEWRSSHPRMARIRSLRTQWARHRIDHGTIGGRSCANSGHYKLLCACVDRTYQYASGRRPENLKPAPRRDCPISCRCQRESWPPAATGCRYQCCRANGRGRLVSVASRVSAGGNTIVCSTTGIGNQPSTGGL